MSSRSTSGRDLSFRGALIIVAAAALVVLLFWIAGRV
jgi:hypothetical protein